MKFPMLLRGLQAIYCNREARDQVFAELRRLIPSHANIKNGRPGMMLWKIFVLGALRLTCNWDYDKLQEFANNHMTLRQMMGRRKMDAQALNTRFKY